MLSIKSIAGKLGFSAGVVEQSTIVVADKVSKAVKSTTKTVANYDYKGVSKEFKSGRISGKEYVKSHCNNNAQALLEGGNVEVKLITL
jgi:hypothetical protein